MRVLLSLSLLISLPVMACPDLSGQYTRCVSNVSDSDSNSTNVVWTQSQLNGVTTFHGTEQATNGDVVSFEFVADGQTYTSEPSPDGIRLHTVATAQCDAEALITNTEIMNGTTSLGQINVRVFKQSESLVKEVSGSFMGTNFSEVITCR